MARLKKFLGIDGVYLDGTFNLNPSDNPAFGCGIPKQDGTQRVPTVPVERIRSLARRVNNLFIQDGGVIYAHLTLTPPTSGFVTAQYLGEHLGFINRNWNSVSDLIDDATAKALYAGKNSGVPTSLCCQLMWPHLASKKPRWYEKAAAWCGIYRSALPSLAPVPKSWPQNDKEWVRKTKLANWGVDTAEWIPYWELSEKLLATNRALRMSVWRRRDGAMIWAVQNNSNALVNGRIGLSGDLAPPLGSVARDLLSDKEMLLSRNGVSLNLKQYEGTLIKISLP
jgi:hypothetical protein